MKKLLALGLGFISCAAMAATNKISMVTYFPVPYVAYSQVNVGNQMDIGLTGSCDMTLGCPESAVTLNAAQVNLLGGRLNLDGGLGIKGDKLTLGSGNNNGKILFQNVRIQEGTTESVNTDNMTVNTELKLFDKTFPSCKDANDKSNGQMQWASLKLKGASSNELYLACGGVASSSEPKADCSDKTYKLTHKSECCPLAAKTDSACYSVILKWKNTTKTRTNGGNDCPRSGTAGPSSFECSKTGDTCELERCAGGDRQCVSLIFECSPSGEYKQLW